MTFFQPPIATVAMLIGMLFFLALSAIYDANGTFVPDALSVPYAILGITSAVLKKNYIAGLIAAVWLLLVLLPTNPKLCAKLNAWLLKRAYKTDDAMEEENAAFEAKAEEFRKKNESRIEKIVTVAYVAVPIVITICALFEGVTASTVAFIVILLAAWLLNAKIAFAGTPEVETDDEPISAFGGADMIILAGMLGFYGVVTFTFCLGATAIIHLIWMIIRKIIWRDKVSVGAPMLPTMFFTFPARLILACTVCPPIVESFQWAFSNLAVF